MRDINFDRSFRCRVFQLIASAIWVLSLLSAGGCSRATSEEDARRIEANLNQIWEAGLQHMLETGKAEALLEDIVGPQKYIKEVRSIRGEDYRGIAINLQLESLSVRAKDGRVITWHTASSPLKQVRDKYRGH